MKKLLLLPCLLLSLALTACGGGEEATGGRGGEEAEIVATVEKVLGHPEPADCRKLETLRYLEQTARGTGKTAMAYCENEARETASEGSKESVEVSDVSLNGSKALARAAYVEGPIDGAAVLIALVRSDDGWKLDEAVRYLNFDKQKLIKALEESLSASAEGLSPKVVGCISSEFAGVSTKRLEEIVLNAPKLEALLLQAAKSCRSSTG